MCRLDFAALAEGLPTPLMVVDRDLRFVWMNASYLEVTGRTAEQLLGRRLFDAFPSEGEPRAMLEGSLRRVLQTGRPDSLALIRYAIPRPAAQGGGFETRWWSASHTPLRDPDGEVAYVLQNTVDVTEVQRLRDAAAERHLLQRAREAEAAKQSLAAEAASLRGLFDQAPGFMALLQGPEHRIALANAAYQQLVGGRDLVGKRVQEVIPEENQEFLALLHRAYERGEAFVGREMNVKLRRTPNGPLEDRYLDLVFQPVRDEAGRVAGIFVEGSDVTERALAAQHRELLIHELNHRVKNSLAVVQGLAAQTFREQAVTAEARKLFMGRLNALAAAHDALTRSNWDGASLRTVVEQAIEPFDPARFVVDGPDLRLPAKAAISMAMALHELATNAAKYGALSTDGGTVAVVWSADPTQGLCFCWKERGGPVPAAPARQGFGTRLIEQGLAGELGGEARLLFEADGVFCRIDAPTSEGA